MGHRPMTFDEERFSVNLARMKKGGEWYEVVVDPDLAIARKQGASIPIREIVKSGHVYHDAKRGDLAGAHKMKEYFGTEDEFAVAERIILEGELQLTKEHRDMLREQRRKRIIALIARNAIDPRTKLPHPPARIELAFEEARIRIDELKKPEDQLADIVHQLQPILPIRFEEAVLEIHLPALHAAKTFGMISSFGAMHKQTWLADGSFTCELTVPAGLVAEVVDSLSSKTHGAAEITHLQADRNE